MKGTTGTSNGPGNSRGGRVRELDAVRGVAAIAVVLGHLTTAVPAFDDASRAHGLTPLNFFVFSPLDAIIAGGAAVIVFFVLSGYVLTLSYEGAKQTYAGFLVRRVARLWMPYIAAVAVAMVLATLLGGTVVAVASHWFNARWQDTVGVSAILQHLSLVGHFTDNAQYVPVIWSLTDEMRISLVFPLLVAAIALFGWRPGIAAAAVLTAVAVELSYKVSADFATLEYVVCFVVGIALATHRTRIADLLKRTTAWQRWAVALFALLLYTWSAWMPPKLLPGHLAKLADSQATYVLLQTAAAAMFIELARYPGRTREWLLSVVPQYFGRISYSLYLVHTIVLLAVVHLVDPGSLGLMIALFPLVFVLSIALADLSQRWIERPAQGLGRRLAARVERRARLERASRVVPAPAAPIASVRSDREG
jgi:peptidoglycan/LPS O-acetylase OafA/YrhL